MFTEGTMSTTLPRRQALKWLGMGALGLSFASCGSSSANNTFVVMSVNDSGRYAPLIQAIEAAHPGLRVQWRTLPSERFTQLFTASEIAGDQIDLLDLNGQDLRRYTQGNKLLDLYNIPFKNRFTAMTLPPCTIQYKLRTLPRGGSAGFTFFYNKKLLHKIGYTQEPQTYDDLRQLAPELRKIGVAPFAHPGKDIYLWPVWFFWAHAQATQNQSIEQTAKTLRGELKFTDTEYVATLELFYKYVQDKMFVQSVNNLETDGTLLLFTQGQAAFYYTHASVIATIRQESYPNLDLGLIPPVLAVPDRTIKRQLPGGSGITGIYADIASERHQLALDIIDLMTNDTWEKWACDLDAAPVSCHNRLQASSDPLALKYATECTPNQITYLDWYWPPELTYAFQQNLQAMVSDRLTPTGAIQAIQSVWENIQQEGYTFIE